MSIQPSLLEIVHDDIESPCVQIRCKKCLNVIGVPRAEIWHAACAHGCRAHGRNRHKMPKTPRAIAAVALMRAGMVYTEAARVVGMKEQSCQMLFFRWLMLPDWTEQKARIAELETELRRLKDGNGHTNGTANGTHANGRPASVPRRA